MQKFDPQTPEVSLTIRSPATLSSPASFRHVLWQHYTVFDGLAGMQVEDICQDQRGFVWIATADGGVSRFDGVHFDNLTVANGLPHPTVMAIAEAEDGGLWLGTLGGGVAVYDGRRCRVYGTAEGLPATEVLGLRRLPDNNMLVLTAGGMARFEGDRCVETVTQAGGQPTGWVYDAVLDRTGALWLASRERVLVDLQGRRLSLDGPEGEALPASPWKLAEDAQGRIWIADRHAGAGLGVYCYDPCLGRLERMAGGDALMEGPSRQGVRHLRVDGRGRVWLAHRGVAFLDGQDWECLALPAEAGLISDTRLTCEDREGNVWVGFWGSGIACGDPLSLRCFDESSGLPDQEVTSLAEDREGHLWIGTLGGLARKEGEQIRPVATQASHVGCMVMDLVVDGRGTLWIGSERGVVCRWDGREMKHLRINEGQHGVSCLCEDRQGRVWVGTTGDQWGWIEGGRYVAGEGGALEGIEAMHQDQQGRLWCGSYGHVPALRYHEAGRFHLPEGKGLDQIRYVSALCETPDGSLWLGTGTGLFALRGEDIRCFTTQDGLSENAISALAVDGQGDLWIGTKGGGAMRYDGRVFHLIRLGTCPARNMVEAIVCDRQGQVWFGTRAGLVAYTPGSAPPGIAIRQVVADQRLCEPEHVSFPESAGEIRLVFQGIAFRAGVQPMLYRYRLAGPGQTGEWSEFSRSSEAVFQHLPAGEYCFEVQALDRDGLCSARALLQLVSTPDPRNHHIAALEKVVSQPQGTEEFVGESPALQAVRAQMALMADADLPVLIAGETGTGKGLAARLLHQMSNRRDRPFIQVNCGAIPENLVESELFGHEKGAFTGAVSRQLGRFELAEGGTLFLDEVGDLPTGAQRALLQVLEEKSLQRLGGDEAIRINVRLMAATNRDLEAAVAEGGFRRDLFFRLRGFDLRLPPLRKRREDIPQLARYFAARYARHLGRPVPQIRPEGMARLQAHSWPGNVRELQRLVEGAVVLCQGAPISVEDFPPLGQEEVSAADFLPLEKHERDYLLKALEATGWVIYGGKGAARLLDIPPERLRSRMRKCGLRRPS